MANGRNLIILRGYLGQDPELRFTGSGTAVTNLRLATTERYKKDGEYVEQTQWHTVTLWDRLAEIANEYASKGSHIEVVGSLKYRTWEDKDGNERMTPEIEARDLNLLSGRQEESDKPDDDLPF